MSEIFLLIAHPFVPRLISAIALIRNANDVFEGLRGLCAYNDYRIKEINNETKAIKAKRGRHIFGVVVELELQISKLDGEIINLKIEILKEALLKKNLKKT